MLHIMTEERKRVNCYISDELYTKLTRSEYTITEAITLGLERLLEPSENKEDTKIPDNSNSFNAGLVEALENRIESLETQISIKDEQLRTQAVHLQTVLNQKAIEAPGTKKPWWRFW
jgi:hypothetical protein